MDNKFQIEVIQRLSTLETLIKEQDYKAVKKTSDDALNKANNNEARIVKLENTNSWIIKTIAVIIIGAIINLILKK